METLRRQISSPAALFTFEAAARLGSFRACATELNVTQPSVSYQIKKLENHLGLPLFDRHGRGVVLTPGGEVLFEAVSQGFATIQNGLLDMRRSVNDKLVTICISNSMASFVLLPRIPSFRAQNPDIELSLKMVDRDVNPRSELADLSIRLGNGKWPELVSWKLFGEVIRPLCSPAYLAEHGPVSSLEELAKCELLHQREPHRKRMTWHEWFEGVGRPGVSIKERVHFSDHQLVLEAAIAGQGVALGWRKVTDVLIEQKLVVQPLAQEIATDQAFYVVASKQNLPLPDHVERTRDWLLSLAN